MATGTAMDYFARLVHRALATPDTRGEKLFDPFDQTAPWPLDTTPALPDSRPGGLPGAERIHPPAPAPVEAHIMEPDMSAIPASPVANAPAPGIPASGQVDRHRQTPAPPTGADRADQNEAPLGPPPPSPLAHADTFMDSLGVPFPGGRNVPPVPEAHSPEKPSLRSPPTSAPPPSAAPSAPGPAARAMPVKPPIAASRDAAPPGARRRRQAEPIPHPADTAPRRPGPPPPQAERLVQTTVVVENTRQALDDLAHGSAIGRFGLGQV